MDHSAGTFQANIYFQFHATWKFEPAIDKFLVINIMQYDIQFNEF